jgi:hypothetical protein
VCRAAGPGTRSTEAWTALVGVADAWSEYVQTRGILNHIATRSALDLSRSAATNATAATPGGLSSLRASARQGILAAIWWTMLTAEPDGLLLHAMFRTLSARVRRPRRRGAH